MLLKNFRRLIRLYNEINPSCVLLTSMASIPFVSESLNDKRLLVSIDGNDEDAGHIMYDIKHTPSNDSEYRVTIVDVCETLSNIEKDPYSNKNEEINVYLMSGAYVYDIVGVYYNDTNEELYLLVEYIG